MGKVQLPTEDEPAVVIHGEAVASMQAMPAGSVDSVVTDPPYGLEFMGKEWDRLVPNRGRHTGTDRKTFSDGGRDFPSDRRPQVSFATQSKNPKCRTCGRYKWDHEPRKCVCEMPNFENRHMGSEQQAFHSEWATAAIRVLRPGGYMLAMGGTRTFHRLACAIEDAGFEIRDTLAWLYGSGFPKGKGCLKPAWEPILLCRKPGPKVLPLGVDECRVVIEPADDIFAKNPHTHGGFGHGDAQVYGNGKGSDYKPGAGRWPANVVHDGSDEVMEAFAEFGERSGMGKARVLRRGISTGAGMGYGSSSPANAEEVGYGDTGTAARFFYCAKASRRERGKGNNHPTVKPLALMRWLVKLVTPKGGIVLDPFLGSGTTGKAAAREGRLFIGIDREREYLDTAAERIQDAESSGPLFAGVRPEPKQIQAENNVG